MYLRCDVGYEEKDFVLDRYVLDHTWIDSDRQYDQFRF